MKMWLWTSNESKHGSKRRTEGMALNAKLKTSNGSKRRNEWCDGSERWTKVWLWTPNETKHGSGCQSEKVALNAKLRMNNDSERRTEDTALNAKMTTRL